MTRPKNQRRLSAILAADLVGYSRMMGEDEAGTLARLKACEKDIIEPLVADHGGRIVKRMGDGYLLEFASVVAAVEAGLAWQGTLAQGDLRFRIGINLGDVIADGEDLYGDGVNIAARLESLAEPGGLCLSEDAYRQARGKIEAPFEDLGEKQLKNIAEPLRVFRSLSGPSPPPTTSADAPSDLWHPTKLILAPFKAIGSSLEAESLAEGLTETLAAALTHFEEIDLADPSSAKDLIEQSGAQATAKTLGADFVVEGTIQTAASKVRVVVRLVEAAGGRRVWSETIDRDGDDPFQLQDDVTAIVASTVGEAVGEELAKLVANKPLEDLSPREKMVRGIQLLHRLNRDDNLRARAIFEDYRKIDPKPPLVRICLGWTLTINHLFNWQEEVERPIDEAVELIGSVLSENDRSAHAHRLMGRLMMMKGDKARCLAHSEKAYQLNPYHSDMIMIYGSALLWVGQSGEAAALMEKAVSINPYSPAYHRLQLGLALLITGRHEEGLAAVADVDRTTGGTSVLRTALLVACGREEEARNLAKEYLQDRAAASVERVLAGFALSMPADREKLSNLLRRAGFS